MAFNNYYIKLFVLLLLTSIFGTLVLWSLQNENLVISRYIIILAWILSFLLLFRYIHKSTRILNTFYDAINNNDFVSISDSNHAFGKEINNILSSLSGKLKNIKIEKEEQYHLFKTAVNQSGSGIIVFNETGKVELINHAALKLFSVSSLNNIAELKNVNSDLPEKLKQSGEQGFIIPVQINYELIKIAAHQNSFILRKQQLKVISLQNISNELDKEELESWKKLMHVITHEIMNSVTPMKTLAYSLFDIFSNNEKPKNFNELDQNQINDTYIGLKALNTRIKGLMTFVDSYRRMYKIPHPNFSNFNFSEIVNEIQPLFKKEFNANNIKLTIKGDRNMKLFADKNLLSQVIINLVKNAIESFNKKSDNLIEIFASDLKENKVISVSDNGAGIENHLLNDIFIPFFTTKTNGTGIGLYYSKLIILMHKGQLRVSSEYEKGSTFTIHL